MIINDQDKTIQMEQRDITYILQAYMNQFEFNTKNAGLKEVVFPMFLRVVHPQTKEPIPIKWVPELSPEAQAIIDDGSDVPEATEEEIAAIDAKEDEIKRLRKELTEANDAITRMSAPAQEKVEQLEDEVADAILEEETFEPAEASPEEVAEDAAISDEEAARDAGRPSQSDTPIQDIDDAARAEEGLEPRPNPFEPEPEVELQHQPLSDYVEKEEEERKEEDSLNAEEDDPTVIETINKSDHGQEHAFNIDPNPDHQPPPDRKPVKPSQEASGSPDSMQPRQRGDQARAAKDLRPEPDINEEEEKPFEKKVGRDEEGKPTVEE